MKTYSGGDPYLESWMEIRKSSRVRPSMKSLLWVVVAIRDTYTRKFQPRSPLLFAWSTKTIVAKILWFRSTDLSTVTLPARGSQSTKFKWLECSNEPSQLHESSSLEDFIRKYFTPVHCIFELFMNEIVNFLIPLIALVFNILKTSSVINMSLADNQFFYL